MSIKKLETKIRALNEKLSDVSIFFSSGNSVLFIVFVDEKILMKDFPYPERKIITARISKTPGNKAGSIISHTKPPLVRLHIVAVKQSTPKDKRNSIIISPPFESSRLAIEYLNYLPTN